MLVLGGTDAPTSCKASPQVAMFDMTNLKWMTDYVRREDNGAYRVPKAVWE